MKCPWIKKLTTSNQPSRDIFLAIHGHDAVGKNILEFGDVYITDVLYPKIITSEVMFLTHGYCGIILIPGGQCLCIVQNFLVRGAVILWVTGFKHNNARQFITSLNVCGEVNSWARVTHGIHEHQSPTKNNDSTVCAKKKY